MYLPRHIEGTLIQSVKEFPIVALMGARQVGKSTMLQHLFNDRYHYLTFDDLSLRTQAKKDPLLFLKNNPGKLILDEIQYVPELLPELKMIVDKKANPGQFILTGSQQFNIIRGMQESLAGRILLLNLPVMTINERAGKGKENHWLRDLLKNGKLDRSLLFSFPEKLTPANSILMGGLPGILTKSKNFYQPFFESYIKTYLERDISYQFNITDIAQIADFIKLLAPLMSHEINKSQVGRELNISPPTANRWLNWLKTTFIWDEVPPYHGNLIKRVSKHSKGYLFDTGVTSHLLHISDEESITSHPTIGNLFETAMRIEIQAILKNYLIPAYCYHWRTPYGNEVDIVIEYRNKLFAFECKWGSEVKSNDLKGLASFKKNYGQQVIFMGVIIPYGHAGFVEEGIYRIPWFLR